MKKILSAILCLCMFFSILPTTVFAAPTTSEALEITNPFTDIADYNQYYGN